MAGVQPKSAPLENSERVVRAKTRASLTGQAPVRTASKRSPDAPKQGYAKTLAAQPVGSGAELVSVEADLTRGLHNFSVVGLADKAVEEARDRVSAAIRHSGYKPPKQQNKRIVLSLSPADLKKEGSHYDLALALAYLIAAGDVPALPEEMLFIGELALDGTLRSVKGVLPQVLAAKRRGTTVIFVPPGNAREALLSEGVAIYAPKSLAELLHHLKGEKPLPRLVRDRRTELPPPSLDLSDVKGQESAKRALEIAAAGRHNIVRLGTHSILPPEMEMVFSPLSSLFSSQGLFSQPAV